MSSYADALILEMKRFLPVERFIKSVYFGGGTPSYFPTKHLIKILAFIKEYFYLTTETEITLEANPGTININSLILLHEAGFNRLSLGLQATQDTLLAKIGRIHTWQQFYDTFELARQIGFNNIGVDLIFGLPSQTIEKWQETLETVIKLAPEHISAYGLQLETGTPLAAMVEDNQLQLPSEEETVTMMKLAMDYLPEKGYQQYEISNYAKSGYNSIHNLGYWTGRHYLGFGAGASSTFFQERWVNIEDPIKYIEVINEGNSAREELETLNQATMMIEALMLGLRMRAGIDVTEFRKNFRFDLVMKAGNEIKRFLEQDLLVLHDNRLKLTDEGVLVSNEIISKLMAVF